MSMIYNLVTAAQEWLAARVAAGPSSGGLDPEAEEKRRRDEEVGTPGMAACWCVSLVHGLLSAMVQRHQLPDRLCY